MILNPSKMHDGQPVRVRRDGSSHAHIQFEMDEGINRPYGAVYDVPVTNELGAFVLGLATQASYTPVNSLASKSPTYMAGTLHAYEDGGVVFEAELDGVPVWARPFFDGGRVRVGFSADSVPEVIANLL